MEKLQVSKLIEHAITNLQSAKAVIQHLKKENPDLKEVTVPDHVKAQINEDLIALSNELGVVIPQQSPIHGVRIASESEKKGLAANEMAVQRAVKQLMDLEKTNRSRFKATDPWHL